MGGPLPMSQSRAVPSLPALARTVPAGENASEWTGQPWSPTTNMLRPSDSRTTAGSAASAHCTAGPVSHQPEPLRLVWQARQLYHPGMATSVRSPSAAVFNLPNGLTLARLILAVVLFCCIAAAWWLVGLVVFILAAITDWLD